MPTSTSPLKSLSRPLLLLTAGCLAVLAASFVLMLVDPRQLMGASVWLKPAKFAVSIAIAAGTLAVLLRHIHLPAAGGRRATAVIVVTAALELVIITVQAARGVPSHFNATSALNVALFSAMGIGISIFTVAVGYVTLHAFRQRFADRDRALGLGIRLGLVTMLAGSAIAFIMPRPTPAQIELMRAGHAPAMVGAHAVGVADGGPGLPVTRWSTEGGDLRVPHFLGIHALQILPLVGWLLGRRSRGNAAGAARAARLTAVAGAGMIGLVAVTLVQALRGVPLAAPDPITVALAAVVVAGCGLMAAWPARACTRPVTTGGARVTAPAA